MRPPRFDALRIVVLPVTLILVWCAARTDVPPAQQCQASTSHTNVTVYPGGVPSTAVLEAKLRTLIVND